MTTAVVESPASTPRANLARYFRIKARWGTIQETDRRAGKNEYHVERLEEVAKHVESLPDDDETLTLALQLPYLPYDVLHDFTVNCSFDGDYRGQSVSWWFRKWVRIAAAACDPEEVGACLELDCPSCSGPCLHLFVYDENWYICDKCTIRWCFGSGNWTIPDHVDIEKMTATNIEILKMYRPV